MTPPSLRLASFPFRAAIELDAPWSPMDVTRHLVPALRSHFSDVPETAFQPSPPAVLCMDTAPQPPGRYELGLSLVRASSNPYTGHRLELSAAVFAGETAVAWSYDLQGTAKRTLSTGVELSLREPEHAAKERLVSALGTSAAKARFSHTKGPSGRVCGVAISSDGRWVASAHDERSPKRPARWVTVVVWKVDTGEAVAKVTVEDNATGLVWARERFHTVGSRLHAIDPSGVLTSIGEPIRAAREPGFTAGTIAWGERVLAWCGGPHGTPGVTQIVVFEPEGAWRRWLLPDELPCEHAHVEGDAVVLRSGARRWRLDPGAEALVELPPAADPSAEPSHHFVRLPTGTARANGPSVELVIEGVSRTLSLGFADPASVSCSHPRYLTVAQGCAFGLFELPEGRLALPPILGEVRLRASRKAG